MRRRCTACVPMAATLVIDICEPEFMTLLMFLPIHCYSLGICHIFSFVCVLMDFKIINVKLQFWLINSLKTLHQKPSVKFLVVSSVEAKSNSLTKSKTVTFCIILEKNI